jgi:hypothetical protein
MFVYRKYGPKYTLFVGWILYMSTPALGGGPVKPAAVGDAMDAILIMLLRPSYVAD